jgi:hypothetical protein
MRTMGKAGIIHNWKQAASNRGLFLGGLFFVTMKKARSAA